MNRGQQQPQQRPQNLPPAPGMTQFSRQLYPTGYSNVPPRGSIPQSYPALQQHRPQNMLPQTPGFMPRAGGGFFGPSQVIGNAALQPSPNPQLPSLQPSQNSVQQLQQPQPQHQPSSTSNGLSQHLATPGGAQSGTGTPANASTAGTSTSDSGLDPNEFPALGSGTGPQSSSAATPSGSNIHTSYASQAGTAISSGPGSIGTSVNGPGSSARDFRPEDFPALSGQASSVQAQQPQSNQGQQDMQSEPSQQQQASMGGLPLSGQSMLPPGINLGQGQSRPNQNYLKMGQTNLWSQSQSNTTSAYPQHLTNGMGQSNLGLPSGVPQAASFNGQPQQTLSQIHQIQHPDGPSNVPIPASSNSQPNQPAGQSQTALPQTPAQQILLSAADRWGLLSLLASIKGSDPDAQLLAIGSDLSGIGLDMNTNGNLYSSFMTPWSDSSAALSIEPEFHLPTCYNVSTPAPGPAKAASFSDETLFFMFYSSPRDTLQEIAAQELHNRNWRFHKEARLWLTKESGQTPFQKGATFERGTYTFFDPEAWEKTKREATIYYEQLEDRSTVPPPITGAGLNTVPPQMGMGVSMPGMPPMGMQAGPGVAVGQMQQPLGMRG